MSIFTHRNDPAAVPPYHRVAIESELTAILKSPHFSGSKRCQEFLEFIVHQKLDGHDDALNERFLGMELFGRPIDYETGTDSIVRVRANDVRRRLALYYSDHPAGTSTTIHLASGTYIPEFHVPEPVGAHPADVVHPAHGFADGATHELAEPHAAMWPRLVGAVVLALLIGGWAGWWFKARSTEHQLYPWRYSPAVNALWHGILDNGHATDVVLSDASFQLVQDVGGKRFTLDQYLNRSYISNVAIQSAPVDLQTVLSQISTKNFGNSGEFRLARRLLTLDPLGTWIHIYNARDYSSSLITQDNVILIGSQYTNPWQQLFNGQLNFNALDPEKGGRRLIVNRKPKPGEPASYTPTDAVGYCIVAYLPNPGTSSAAVLIEGSSSEATEAGGDFLLSEDQLGAFLRQLHADRFPYFEVLLKTAQARGTPIAATLESYRTYPGQN